MQFDINAQAGEYLFSVNGTLVYRAGWPGFTLKYKMNLYPGNTSTPSMLIQKKSSLFSYRFVMTRSDKTEAVLKIYNMVLRHLQCIDKNDTYDIYAHKNDACSVYKNNIQVASWYMKYLPDRKIIADSDADQELIISFYLITQKLNFASNDQQGLTQKIIADITEARPFDENWQPH